jgi:hypothetical protein
LVVLSPKLQYASDALKNLKITAKFTHTRSNSYDFSKEAVQRDDTSVYEFTYASSGLSNGYSIYQIAVDVNLIHLKNNNNI